MSIATAEKRAHREAMQNSAQDVARLLQDNLGQKLVAHMTGVSPDTVGKWASGAVDPRSKNDELLRTIFQIFQLLLAVETVHTIRAWFVGLNPQLSDVSPAAAIAEGRAIDAMVAAKAFLVGG